MLESIEKLRENIWDGHKTTRIKQSALLIYLDAIEREIAEKYTPLPVDEDGVPWTSEDSKFDAVAEGTIELDMIAYSVKTGRWYLLDDRRMSYVASVCRHVKERTIEDILRDVWEEALDYAKSDIWRDPDEVFTERADELREMLKR